MGHLYKLDFGSGKSYIGQSTRAPGARFADHCRDAKTVDHLLYRAWRKHGEPKMTILAFIEDRLLDETEIRAIEAYSTLAPLGYNMVPGGHSSSGMLGKAHNEGSRAKMSIVHKARYEKMTPADRKAAAYSVGEDTRKKMSMSHSGIPRKSHSEAMKLWWKNATPEQLESRKSKLSESVKASHTSGSRKPRRDSKSILIEKEPTWAIFSFPSVAKPATL